MSSNSSGSAASVSTPQKTYVDNSQNRRLGRVGEVAGSHVQHKDGSVTISSAGTDTSLGSASSASGYYIDNSFNRKLGRVGKPKGTHVVHKDGSVTRQKQREIERDIGSSSTLEELLTNLHDLHFSDPVYPVLTNVQYKLQRNEVEESWKKDGIAPSTDHVIATERKREIIPLSEVQLDKQIGEGGFGTVYAGLWKATPIAFKKFIYQQITTKKQDLLVREIKIFSALDHPNIVRMFGVVLERNNFGIIMEYLPKTLFYAIFIEELKFQVSDKRRIVSEIVSAVGYLHTEIDGVQNPKPAIAHCDIKSQNILLDSNNVAKLCDFGLSAIKNAQASSSRTSAAPGQGTPRYSAPEVLRGEVLSMTGLMMSDIYSLTLVICEILTEEEPFENFNLLQLVENVGRKNSRPPLEETSLSKAMQQLLLKGWHGDAKCRPNIGKFSEELSKIDSFFAK